MAGDSHSPTSLGIATANAILGFLGGTTPTPITTEPPTLHMGGRDFILSLASDLQAILGDEAMLLATNMLPHKPKAPATERTLPYPLWPKAVQHDIFAIRRRTKALRRLATLVASPPPTEPADPSITESPRHHL